MERTKRYGRWFGMTALGLSLLAAPLDGTASRDRVPLASPAGKTMAGHGGCGAVVSQSDGGKLLRADYRVIDADPFTPARHCLRRGPWSGPDLSSRRISST